MFQVIGWVVFNQAVVGLPVAYVSYLMMKWRGSPPLRELPTFHWVLAEMVVHILMEEIGFYYSHRYCLSSCKLLSLGTLYVQLSVAYSSSAEES